MQNPQRSAFFTAFGNLISFAPHRIIVFVQAYELCRIIHASELKNR